jgi:hypothetical protein
MARRLIPSSILIKSDPLPINHRDQTQFQEKMPKLLSPAGGVGSRVTPLPQAIREKLKVMTAENWSQIRDEILGIFDAGAA